MPHPFGDDDPLTIKRVQRRVEALIEAMPTRKDKVFRDQLLVDIRDDMIRISRALEYLKQVGRVVDD